MVCLPTCKVYVLLLCVRCDGCVHAHVCVPLFAYVHVVYVKCVCAHMHVYMCELRIVECA